MILIDRVVALVVSTMVVLMGFTVQQRAQQTSVGSAMIYVGKKQTLELADWLERDLANVGFNITPDQVAVTDYTKRLNENLQRLQFYGSDAGGNQVEIRYDLVMADTTVQNGETIQLYELQRFEYDGASWVASGGSQATITKFYIDLLGETNTPVAREDTRRIRIWLENMVIPKADMGKLMQGFRKLRWGVTVSPPNLRGYQGS